MPGGGRAHTTRPLLLHSGVGQVHEKVVQLPRVQGVPLGSHPGEALRGRVGDLKERRKGRSENPPTNGSGLAQKTNNSIKTSKSRCVRAF